MKYCDSYEYKGFEFEIYQVNPCIGVSMNDRMHLCQQAVQMAVEKEKRRTIKTDSLEGLIKSTGKRFVVGGFARGTLFEGDIENDKGKHKFAFLVDDVTHVYN